MSNTSEPSQGVVEVLKTFLSRFRDAPKKQRRGIISEATKASEAPSMIKSEVAKHKKVSNTHVFIYEWSSFNSCNWKVVKAWFYNHGRKNAVRDHVNYVKKWSLKMVVDHVKKAEVKELCQKQTGASPGQPEYLAGYQTALKEIEDGLSEVEKEEYERLAKEWTGQSPPEEVQRR